MLREVSSLPLDEAMEGAGEFTYIILCIDVEVCFQVSNNAHILCTSTIPYPTACSDGSLPSSTNSDEVACYPIAGYMTAYYDGADAASIEEVQAAVGDIIQQSLGSDLLGASDASEESGIAGVRYVENKADANPFNGSNSSNQLASPDEGLSNAAIGGIAGGAAALVLLLCLAVCALRRSKGGKDTAATEGCDSDSEEGERRAVSSVVATGENEGDEESMDGYEYGVNSFAEDNSVAAEMEGRRLDSRSRSGQWVRQSMTGATEATVQASNVTAPRRLF